MVEKFTAEMGIKDRLRLRRPNWLTAVLFGASVLVGLFVAAIVPASYAFRALLVLPCAAVLTGFAAAALTKHQSLEFPRETRTVGDMSRWLMSRKPDLAGAWPAGWTREQVATRVREIVIGVLGCEESYREDARFVEELGLS